MSQSDRTCFVADAVAPAFVREERHPATFTPATLILIIVLSVFGAVIGVQLIVQLGVTPNTSIIGALVAMILARAAGIFRALSLDPCAEPGTKRDLRRYLRCREQPSAAYRGSVPARPSRSHLRDVGGCRPIDAARR